MTDNVAHLIDGSVEAIPRPGAASRPGMTVERISLARNCADYRQAMLIV